MTKKICIITSCKECGHKDYDRMEGGYECFKVRDEHGYPRKLGWNLPTNIPDWCPLENFKEEKHDNKTETMV